MWATVYMAAGDFAGTVAASGERWTDVRPVIGPSRCKNICREKPWRAVDLQQTGEYHDEIAIRANLYPCAIEKIGSVISVVGGPSLFSVMDGSHSPVWVGRVIGIF
jgi:hypothetical protein